MSPRRPLRKTPRGKLAIDRRAAADATGPLVALRRLKGLMSRPLGLQRRDGQLRLVLVDRRRTDRPDRPPTLEDLRAELGDRIMAHEATHAAHVMRHLVQVHEALGGGGWRGVEALPAEVLHKALAQAELLASAETSPAILQVVERLRLTKVAADLREERQAQARLKAELSAQREAATPAAAHRAQALHLPPDSSGPEVSETTAEDYEDTNRRWVDTVQPEPEPGSKAS